MTALPGTLYLVVRDFGAIGIGSSDISERYGAAFDQFDEAVSSGEPVTVWQIDTVCGQPQRVTDITDDVEQDHIRTQRRRGNSITIATRFDAPPLPIAAE